MRISASILGFYFEAKEKNVSLGAMIAKINSELKKYDKDFDILHIDIEDGIFVAQKSFTPAIVRKIACTKKREVHLMVEDYNYYIKEFFDLSDMFIIHNEVVRKDFEKTISFLKKNKKYIGICINPRTSLKEIEYLDKVDSVLVMSVNPGLPGQRFIKNTLLKVKRLYELRKEKNYHFTIEVDGGIDTQVADELNRAGADIVVMGSHFFK